MSYKKIFTRIAVLSFSAMLILPGFTFPAEAKEEGTKGESVTVAEGDVALDEAHFPDSNFREALKQYDYNKDGILSKQENEKLTYLSVDNKNITDLRGIEYLSSLEVFTCRENKIESLDLSKNTKIQDVYCTDSGIKSLNLSGCRELTDLVCGYNELTALDLSQNEKLVHATLSSNQIEKIDLSHNVNLKELFLDDNELTSLDLSHNTGLTNLTCYDNHLTFLDLMKHDKLNILFTNFQKVSMEAQKRNGKWTIMMPWYLETADLSRVNVWDEGFSYDASTGLLTLPDNKPEMFEYTYKTTDKKLAEADVEYMWVEVDVTYSNRTLESLAVTAPKKTEYTVGEELDLTGMKVIANYDDGTTKDVTSEVKIEGFDSQTAGEKTVTVTYKGKKTTFTVTVKEKEDPKQPIENIFKDVKTGDWYYDEVAWVYENGLMTGYKHAPDLFGPADCLKRAQFAQILYNYAGEPEAEFESVLGDVHEGDWYASSVIWAYKKGIITGYTDTQTFGPADDITREQIATILYRYAGKPGIKNPDILNNYPDTNKISGFASDAMKWAVEKGIITGDKGNLNPGGKANRAETAAMMQRVVPVLEAK